MRLLRVAAVSLMFAAALAGCQTITGVYDSLTNQTPTQVTTLADAVNAAKLVTDAVDVYVRAGSPNRATLVELQALSNGVHAALTNLEAAQLAGGSLSFASFNAALAAFQAYASSQGVSTS